MLTSHISDAFGATASSSSCPTSDPYDGYGAQSGYYTDHETGLVLCTFRYYDPANGRWLTRDPIGYTGGINLYSYCTNNPIMGIDPLGLLIFSSAIPAGAPTRIGYALPWDPNVDSFAGVPPRHQYVHNDPYGDLVQWACDNPLEAAAVAAAILDGVGELAAADEVIAGSLSLEVRAAGEEVAEGSKPFAMGLDKAGLDEFAAERGATTWKAFPEPAKWQSGVIDKLSNPNVTVHFNLNEVEVWPGVQRAASGRGGPTDWELLQIKSNPTWKVRFWNNGVEVESPF